MVLSFILLWILAKLHAPLWTYLVLILYATLRTIEFSMTCDAYNIIKLASKYILENGVDKKDE